MIVIALRKALAKSELLVSIKQQWPIYRPRAVVTDLDTWIGMRREKIGWYGAQSDVAFVQEYASSCRLLTGYPIRSETERTPKRIWNVPRSGVLFVPSAYVYSERGYVLSPENELINELSPGWSVDLSKNPSFPGLPFSTFSWQIRRLDGVSLLLACDGTKSYYHFLLQLLPRIHLARKYLIMADHVIIPSHLNERQIKAIVECGIDASKLLSVGPKEKLQLEYLIAPTIPGDRGAIPMWVVQFIRSSFLQTQSKSIDAQTHSHAAQIYLYRGRKYSRVIDNEDDIVEALARRSFRILDCGDLSLREQAAALQGARLIVAPHGAALTNIVFAPPRASIVELFHPQHVISQYYQTLSEVLGCGYQAITGRLSEDGKTSIDSYEVLHAVQNANEYIAKNIE